MDTALYLRSLAALAAVLGLLFVLVWFLRRFGAGRMVSLASGKRRLNIVETLGVDARRRLILVRRDDVEHLILLGPTTDLLIERTIAAPAASAGSADGKEERA